MSALRGIGWTLLLPAILGVAEGAAAQTRMSLVGGLAISELAGEDGERANFENRKGVYIGAAAEIPLFGVLSVHPGGAYLDRGYTYADGTTKVKLSFVEVSAPLRLDLPIGPATVGVFASPGIALAFGCVFSEEREDVLSSTDCQPSDFEFKSWDVTGIAGVGLSFPLSGDTRLLLNGALDTSLISIDSGSPKGDFKHRSLLINAGVSFPLRNR